MVYVWEPAKERLEAWPQGRCLGAKRLKALDVDGLQILIWVPEGAWPQGITKGAVSLRTREASAATSLEAKPPLQAQVKGVQMAAFRTLSLEKGPMREHECKNKKSIQLRILSFSCVR